MSDEPSGAIDRDFDESEKTPDHVTDIKANDVCVDLQTRQVVFVVGRKAASVAEYREEEGFDLATYKAHPYLPVHDDDPVFECVFVPSNPDDLMHPERSLKTYDFPRGRLARVAIECATKDARPQEVFLRTALKTMLTVAHDVSEGSDTDVGLTEAVLAVARATFDERIVADALQDADVPTREDADNGSNLGDFE